MKSFLPLLITSTFFRAFHANCIQRVRQLSNALAQRKKSVASQAAANTPKLLRMLCPECPHSPTHIPLRILLPSQFPPFPLKLRAQASLPPMQQQ
jgi:hypothetical protein